MSCNQGWLLLLKDEPVFPTFLPLTPKLRRHLHLGFTWYWSQGSVRATQALSWLSSIFSSDMEYIWTLSASHYLTQSKNTTNAHLVPKNGNSFCSLRCWYNPGHCQRKFWFSAWSNKYLLQTNTQFKSNQSFWILILTFSKTQKPTHPTALIFSFENPILSSTMGWVTTEILESIFLENMKTRRKAAVLSGNCFSLPVSRPRGWGRHWLPWAPR